jgi:hypothetical protein
MRKTIIIVCLIALFGCQTVLDDVAVPQAEVKAVVFYSANNLGGLGNQLSLTKSIPVLNNSHSGDFDPILNADIALTGNGKQVDFIYAYPGYIRNNRGFSFSTGMEYTLDIITPENGTISSTVIMPDSIENYTLEIDSVVQDFQIEYTGRLSIPDNPNLGEYYRIEAFSRYNGVRSRMYVDGEYFSDENTSNGDVNARFTTYSYEYKEGDRHEVYIIISSITKEHYDYGKALENYDPENPFSEPSPLPNNIEGGLGLFTLSNSKLIQIR